MAWKEGVWCGPEADRKHRASAAISVTPRTVRHSASDACGGARVEAFRCPERGDADPTALNGEVADAARLIARSHGKHRVGVVGLMKDVVAFALYVRRGHSCRTTSSGVTGFSASWFRPLRMFRSRAK